MSDTAEVRTTTAVRPSSDDADGWRAHWRERGQPWRSEQEIAPERVRELERLRRIPANARQGLYPFGGVTLSRGDVEWLLATHDDGRGPVRWSDKDGGERVGLDLRGSDLRGVYLAGLPLARLRGGLTSDDMRNAGAEQLRAARVHLEGADLSGAHLEGAILEGACLEGATLSAAFLSGASLDFALLDGAYLTGAHLEGASLVSASLLGATANEIHCAGANLSQARLSGAELLAAHLEGATLREAGLGGVCLAAADLARIRRVRPDFPPALGGAHLGSAFLDSATALDSAELADAESGGISLADIRWGGVNLAVMDWERVRMLGDEAEARRAETWSGVAKDEATRLDEFRVAVRANRQLAVALREQGLNEEADRFAYAAQRLQRQVLRRETFGREDGRGGRKPRRGRSVRLRRRAQKLGAYLFSLFLDALSGYGYKPGRSLVAYIATLVLFSGVYYVVGNAIGTPLGIVGAVALSINSFHGRGFFPGVVTPGDPVTVAAAVEAIVGLIIELSFIATFTQRYFAR